MLELFEKQYSGYDQPILDLESVRFTLYLISFKGCIGPDRTIEKKWVDLKFAQISNRWWYFRRVAAKMQIDNPFRIFTFHVERTLNEQDVIKARVKQLTDKARSAKAKITEVTRKLDAAKAAWNSLFPIEDDLNYQKAMAYLFQKRNELNDLESEINHLTNNST